MVLDVSISRLNNELGWLEFDIAGFSTWRTTSYGARMDAVKKEKALRMERDRKKVELRAIHGRKERIERNQRLMKCHRNNV